MLAARRGAHRPACAILRMDQAWFHAPSAVGPRFAVTWIMAQQQHPSIPESSRFPRAPQPFLPTDDPLEQVGTPSRDVAPTHLLPVDRDISGPPSAAPRRVVSQPQLPVDVNAFGRAPEFEPRDSERHGYRASYDDGQPYEARPADSKRNFEQEYAAPRRQARADDEVQYTTSPFAVPGSEAHIPVEKPGLGSRVLGTACLAASAVLGVAALVLTIFMQVYIAVPTFLVAGALFYAGRGSWRESAERNGERSDPYSVR